MDRKQFGTYCAFLKEPETEIEKAEYIKKAVPYLLDKLTSGTGIVPDWNTIQVIVKEGVDFFSYDDLDWYADEKEGYRPAIPRWRMTVGIKFYSKQYPEGKAMPEINKVIKAMDACIGSDDCAGHTCPYWDYDGDVGCRTQMEMDALELLKEYRTTE